MYKKFRYLGSTVHIYEFNQRTKSMRIDKGIEGKLEPLSRMAKGALARVNCGFFNFNGSSEHLGTWSRNWTTVCYNDNGDQLLKFHDAEELTTEQIAKIASENTHVFGAAFTVIEDGKKSIRNTEPFPHHAQRHPRTMIAQRPNRNILLIVVEGRRANERGMRAVDLAALGSSLGVRCAVTFDGGGSSEMMVGEKIMNRPSDGRERAIGSCLAVFNK